LPRDEQIRNESYVVNNRYVFFLKEIGQNRAGYSRIILSRTSPKLIEELFKREVPEIANGTVEIKNVVREPGERAKIAVHSSQSGVDPVGACVGQKGVRVQTVTDELNGQEKIDIIQWNENPKTYIISALSPAKVISVEINDEDKVAKVTVEESQAPLAIGKNGINVNLAGRLTGYNIDIVQIASETSEEAPKKNEEEVLEPSEVQPEESKSEENIESAPETATSAEETPIQTEGASPSTENEEKAEQTEEVSEPETDQPEVSETETTAEEPESTPAEAPEEKKES
jgi:N utilization substance protein A